MKRLVAITTDTLELTHEGGRMGPYDIGVVGYVGVAADILHAL